VDDVALGGLVDALGREGQGLLAGFLVGGRENALHRGAHGGADGLVVKAALLVGDETLEGLLAVGHGSLS